MNSTSDHPIVAPGNKKQKATPKGKQKKILGYELFSKKTTETSVLQDEFV